MPSTRRQICHKLHDTYPLHGFDNQDVWAGNMCIELDGVSFDATLARAFTGPEKRRASGRVRAELYLRDIDAFAVRRADLDARLWTDAGKLGFVDERGAYRSGPGYYRPMHLVVDATGRPVLAGNNLVFESELVHIENPGAFHYTAEFSADDKDPTDPSKAWLSLNDIALNRDGVLVVSPQEVQRGPSVAELCLRKTGALIRDGAFVSGTLRQAARQLEHIAADVIHLLPFFEPGTGDLGTGRDVRKGELGSVYAVRDFFKIDPLLVTPPEEVDLLELVAANLLVDADLVDLLDERQRLRLQRVGDFNHFRTFKELVDWVGRQRLIQMIGRAEMRALTRRAHELGQRVVFDLVLMQTSRDCPLIERHPEWYALDDEGHPKIHQIAWLVYSDVALLDLPFNRPLQNYLSSVAPFWMRTCDLDGVRIDAAQTVDRPFLKQIKNRIHLAKSDALVIGETLCDLGEAVDLPVDLVYALLVDHHRDTERARTYIDFLEYTSATFAPRTVALAYFENHDSPRATPLWRRRFTDLLQDCAPLRKAWRKRIDNPDPALVMALLKNIQCCIIDASAGTAERTNLAYALEWGTQWGEEGQTDFENPTLMHPDQATIPPRADLVRAYAHLRALKQSSPVFSEGAIYFHRNEWEGGDPEDRVLAYTRHTPTCGALILHNLDPQSARRVSCSLADLPRSRLVDAACKPSFDTYSFFCPNASPVEISTKGSRITVQLHPLQSLVLPLQLQPEP